MNPTTPPAIEEIAPFSLKGLKETLLRPIIYYEKFANSNGTAIEALESSLRSISYILPGRFKDSEFVSEILFAILNLFRHYNDLLMTNLDRSMSLNQRNLLAYLSYLKSRHPLMKPLMMIINLVRIVQIPLEMLVAKFAKDKQTLFVLIVELSKFIVKFGIWQGSGWRPVPRQFSIPIDRKDEDNYGTLNEIDDKLKKLEAKMDRLDARLKESKSKDPLNSYLKGHKSNIYTTQPQLSFNPCLDWKSWTRELAHLSRPTIYALSLLLISKEEKSRKNWIPFFISLSLDLYSKWPELNASKPSSSDQSSLESEEKARRLLDVLYYPLRTPLYDAVTSNILDALENKLESVAILAPLNETIKIYRKLWENVYFYTSAS